MNELIKQAHLIKIDTGITKQQQDMMYYILTRGGVCNESNSQLAKSCNFNKKTASIYVSSNINKLAKLGYINTIYQNNGKRRTIAINQEFISKLFVELSQMQHYIMTSL